MSAEHIKQAQQLLKDAGFYDGGIDGHFGQHSLDAINAALGKAVDKTEGLAEGMLSANFSLSELTRSHTASKYKIDNMPRGQHLSNLKEATTELFQPIRDMLNQPMLISSGYRSKTLNAKIGGSSTSAHSYGCAIDFTAPEFGSTCDIAEFLAKELVKKGIKFDQLILEFPNTKRSWIHIGYKNSSGKQRGQLLTAVKSGSRTKYLTGLRY